MIVVDGITRTTTNTLPASPAASSATAHGNFIETFDPVLCFYESGTDKPAVKRKRDWAYANLTLARFNLEWLEQP